jgi:hypothetical protein
LKKLVIVVNEVLGQGTAANVIGLLGISLGHHVPDIVGEDVKDADGQVHPGMSMLGLPVLAAGPETVNAVYWAAVQRGDLQVFDVTDAAVASRNYDAFTTRLQDPTADWSVLGLAVCGERRSVDSVTGQLRLLR